MIANEAAIEAEGAMEVHEQVERAAAEIVRGIAPRLPHIGIVLGSGLGKFADALGDPRSVPYERIPGFASSSVEGHKGRLVAGRCGRNTVLVMQGRVHLYEGHTIERVVLPIRAMVAAGCKIVVVTNAAGAIRDDIDPGDLVLITDHINLLGANPLAGLRDDRLGPCFPDLSAAYDIELRALAHEHARVEGQVLKEGIYCAVSGPSYETPAEVRMLRMLGADLVGMSTVPEVIAAHHMGARVLGISCATNKAAGLGGKLSHGDVQRTTQQVIPRFVALLSRSVGGLKI